jgi:hypothetical protein
LNEDEAPTKRMKTVDVHMDVAEAEPQKDGEAAQTGEDLNDPS